MHTQMHGSTTGREMFQVDEYNNKNKMIEGAIVVDSLIFGILYFLGKYIPLKMIIFLLLIVLAMSFMGYLAYKSKKQLKQNLY